MKFIVDAQLPRLLAIRLCELGHVSVCPLDYRPSAVMNSSTLIPACLRIPDYVPVLISACMGTVQPLSPLRMTTWLPRCLASAKPSRSRALRHSFPLTTGSLGMGNFETG